MNHVINDTRSLTGTTSQAVQANPQTPSPNDGVSQMFVDLLVAQVTNQNPLSPMDGTAYASQLAEFTNVENLTSLNQQMTQQIAMTQSSQALHAASLLGQEATLTQSQLSLAADAEIKGQIRLPAEAERVEVELRNASGTVVASESYSVNDQTTFNFSLGIQSAGNYQIHAVTINGSQRTEAATQMQGSIEQIRMGDNSQSIEVLMQGVGWVNLLDLQGLRRQA